MSIRKNIFANYVGTITVAAGPILALPWYLNALGPQQFGLIGFIILLQAMLGLLDAGMSQAMVKEISIRLGMGDNGQRKVADLLFGFERIYWLFALIAALVVALLAEFISDHWLNLGGLSTSLGEQAVFGAAILFAVQFPGSIYRSMLVSSQKQASLNVIISAASILRHLGAVLVMIKWPLLLTYLIWHCVIGLLETSVRARYAWKSLSVSRRDAVWSTSALKSTWGFVVGMSAATWLGALTVQMDKIILSRIAPIDQFGYYVIAASVAAGVLQMVYPLIQAVLPRAIQLHDKPNELRYLSFRLLKSIALVVVIVGVTFLFTGQWILHLWLGNEQVVEEVSPLLGVLLIGTALNAFYNVGYIYWVVHERVGRIFQVNAIALTLSILLIPPLVLWLGTIGAAFGWVIINLMGFVLSLEWIKRGKYA